MSDSGLVESVLYCQVRGEVAPSRRSSPAPLTVRHAGQTLDQELTVSPSSTFLLATSPWSRMHGITSRPSLATSHAGPGRATLPFYTAPQALQYLVVVLRASAGRAALEALRPETAALLRAYTGGRLMSIIVTAAGALSA